MRFSRQPIVVQRGQRKNKPHILFKLFMVIGTGLIIGFGANIIISSEMNIRKSFVRDNPVLSALDKLHRPALIDYEDEQGFTEEPDFVEIEKGEIPETLHTTEGTVQRGDSLYSILAAQGLSPLEIHGITTQLDGLFSTRSFRAGQKYSVTRDDEGNFRRFTYHQSRSITLHVEWDVVSEEFHVSKEVQDYDTRTSSLTGIITSNLANELQRNGRYGLITQLENVLSWRIDFNRDIQPGSQYRIIFEEKWLNDQYVGVGNILAAEITIRNNTYTAYRYQDPQGVVGYYDEKGDSMQRFFLNRPVNYSRVSSPYGYRVHPVYGTRHFHGGVDLVAPTGTPVYAVADGQVIFRGRKGPAGNMITLSHANGYHTQYLHLSRYAVNYGSRVRQGDIIGYVGATGVATGPHLDFRVIRNGRLQDPMQALASSSAAQSVASEHRNDFLAKRGMLRAQLDELGIQLASAER